VKERNVNEDTHLWKKNICSVIRLTGSLLLHFIGSFTGEHRFSTLGFFLQLLLKITFEIKCHRFVTGHMLFISPISQ